MSQELDSTLGADALEFTGVQEALPGIVRAALDEDLGAEPGVDVTTLATIPATQTSRADAVARAEGVIGGLLVIPEVLHQVAQRFDLPVPQVEFAVRDSHRAVPGTVLATITGHTRVLLIAERTMLNLLSRASGVATATAAWVRELEGTGVRVLDTRKTMPGLRSLDKYAVRCGGGTNKRMGLYDVAMIKDNHVAAAGSIAQAIRAVRSAYPLVDVQVEADTAEQAAEAVAHGADFLLLDNMSDELLRHTVQLVRAQEPEHGKVWLEATGNLTLERARRVADCGVDFMSVGGLTHSSAILDIGLDLA